MTRAAIYARVSVDRDGDAGSIPGQLKACRAFAEAKGWDVAHELQDTGVSAFATKERPGWSEVVRLVDMHEVDVVVVFAVSRAARNTRRLLEFVELAEERGVAFESVSEPIGGRFGKVFMTILASLAELESQMKSDRQVLGRRERDAKGLWSGGRRPFGWRIVGSPGAYQLEIDPIEAAHIREGVTLLLNGASLTSVARHWSARGITTSGGNTWTSSAVKMLLSGATLDGIVSPRDIAALRGRYPANGVKNVRALLTGILVCDLCGGNMVGRGVRYICRGGDGGAVHLTVSRSAIEDYIKDQAAQAELTEAYVASDPTEPLVAERDRIEHAMEALGDSDLPEPVLRGRARKLQRELEDVEKQLLELEPARMVVDWTDYLGAVATRLRIESVIEHVTIAPITPARRGSHVFDHDRVEITWREGVE